MENVASSKKQRVALVIQYLGNDFHGWQRQPKQRTVQEELEKAITEVLGHRLNVKAAGRTDSGVHAAAQVAHFDTFSPIPAMRWADILNPRLPDDVLIRASASVPLTWHARFSARWRRYRYTFYTDKRPNLFVKPFSWHYYHSPLNPFLMQEALIPLMGKHHLSAFHRAGSDRDHSWVDIQAVQCYQQGPLIHVEIQANGFLYGMVRLLMGMLVEVGSGKRSLANFTDIWVKERREEVKYSAPPQGLCLLRVGYEEFPFPSHVWFDTQPLFIFNQVLDSSLSVTQGRIPCSMS
ncbi:tRNA pseudouridine(38-40) synthase TruA [Aphanothece sacrum]|uniref:tRNA pseudouridine synthase A n=1 Tax=Aphanothece sacrum FPU1 TaxID=1920663 RepID=A0A401IFA8_APHSA|nr:tRNA pseudouridine(38-40) synthase TruA [Aphanothece sacrum]GBF79889.1 tRNA pseudouridine synthase A [Aphanothece sacrum FPU1]GBF83891.1 tRNA pseudouridine synthase A [Aphanothece sacrum FPU3]